MSKGSSTSTDYFKDTIIFSLNQRFSTIGVTITGLDFLSVIYHCLCLRPTDCNVDYLLQTNVLELKMLSTEVETKKKEVEEKQDSQEPLDKSVLDNFTKNLFPGINLYVYVSLRKICTQPCARSRSIRLQCERSSKGVSLAAMVTKSVPRHASPVLLEFFHEQGNIVYIQLWPHVGRQMSQGENLGLSALPTELVGLLHIIYPVVTDSIR